MITAIVRQVQQILAGSGRSDVDVEIVFPVASEAITTSDRAREVAPMVCLSFLDCFASQCEGLPGLSTCRPQQAAVLQLLHMQGRQHCAELHLLLPFGWCLSAAGHRNSML